MNLSDLGFDNEISTYLRDNNLTGFSAGRVIRENRERYIVSTGDEDYEAEITGNLRFSANERADFPAVGDWVTMTVYDSGQAIIHKVLPRKTLLERQAVGRYGEKQIISANIDFAFIIQAITNNFNINRLERYLTICYSAGIEPVFVISKTDLSSDEEIKNAIRILESRDRKVKYFLLSNLTLEGLGRIKEFIQAGKTYCVIGSSGVGKSTLINNLLKKEVLKTGQISHSTNKGRHITGHRELFVLENGGIIIDTPGMKELGMTESEDGIKTTFQEIYDLSHECRFPDCKHINETGCAILEALDKGIIDSDSLDNYRKLLVEQERFQVTVAEKRRKEKIFGKMLKNYHKTMKKNN